jgi:hypothetical protein
VIPCAASHGSMMASDEDFSSSYDYYYLGKSWLVREIIPKTALIQVSEILQFTQITMIQSLRPFLFGGESVEATWMFSYRRTS